MDGCKQERMDALLRSSMARRANEAGRRNAGLAAIAISYEEVAHYARSNERNCDTMRAMATDLNARIREVAGLYGLTGQDIRAYFSRHGYSLNF